MCLKKYQKDKSVAVPRGVRLWGDIPFLFYRGLFRFSEGSFNLLGAGVGIAHILIPITGLLVKMSSGGREGAQGHTLFLCHMSAMDLAQAGSMVESKIYDTLQWQVRGQWGDVDCTVQEGRLLGVTVLYHPSLPRSGPSCLGSARGPQMWLPPSKGWHGHWAQPSVSAQTCGALCARPCAPSSPRAVEQVQVGSAQGAGGRMVRWHGFPGPTSWSVTALCLSCSSSFARTRGFCWVPKDAKNCPFSLFTPSVLTAMWSYLVSVEGFL